MTTHTYTNAAGRKYLFINVPTGANSISIVPNTKAIPFNLKYTEKGFVFPSTEYIDLPPNATYRFIALRSDISEEQCREIVDKWQGGYYPYDTEYAHSGYDSAQMSVQSLFTSLHIPETQEIAIVEQLNKIV